MTNAKDLRGKSDQDLHRLLGEFRTTLHDLSFKAALKQLKDVRALRTVKRDIARCLTVLRERRTP